MPATTSENTLLLEVHDVGFLLDRLGEDCQPLQFLRELTQYAIEAILKHMAAYLMAVGGAAYLVAKAIRKSKVLAFNDLGMEAIYEFEVKDMPVTVAVDANGTSVHQTGPAEWERRIKDFKIPVAVA